MNPSANLSHVEAVLDALCFEPRELDNYEEQLEAKEWGYYRAALIFEQMPDGASRVTFIAALRRMFPAMGPRLAERIVDFVIRRRTKKRKPQFGPHPTDIFALAPDPLLDAENARLRRLALTMYLEKRAVRPKHDPVPSTPAKTEDQRAEEELERLRAEREKSFAPLRNPAERAIVPTPYVWTDPATIPRRQWLYGRHLIRGEVSLTLAPGGVGKTSLAAADVAAMASGRALLHDHPERALRVWWWNGEEPRDEMARRLAAVVKHYGLPASAFDDRLFFDNGHDLPLVLAEQGKDGTRILAPVVDRLVAALKELQIDVMLVDPFVSTHCVHENDNSAIQRAASAWKEVAQRAGVAIGLAHHTRKPGGRDVTAEDSRGGDALVSKVRDARALNPMSEADAKRLGIPARDRHCYFSTGTGGKSNMAPKSDRKTWFQIVSVGLGNSQGLSAPEDRVAVVTKWEPPVVEQELSLAAVARLADIMGDEEWRASQQARGWLGHAVAEAFELGSEDGWEGRARLIIKELDARRIIVGGYGQDERRKTVPVFRLGERETAEI